MKDKFIIFLYPAACALFFNFTSTLSVSAQEELTSNNAEQKQLLVSWFKEPKALPGHPLGIDENIFPSFDEQSRSALSKDSNRTYVTFERINKKENIWELVPEKGYQMPLHIILSLSEGTTEIVAASALLLGGTYTYKDLDKGQPVKIGKDVFLCLKEGDHIVEIGSQINVDEGLLPFSNIVLAEAHGKLNKTWVVQVLIAALQDKDFTVQREAVGVLSEMTGQNFGQDLAKWQEWWEKNKGKFGKGK